MRCLSVVVVVRNTRKAAGRRTSEVQYALRRTARGNRTSSRAEGLQSVNKNVTKL